MSETILKKKEKYQVSIRDKSKHSFISSVRDSLVSSHLFKAYFSKLRCMIENSPNSPSEILMFILDKLESDKER